jgi:hypothetical protein
MASPRSGRRQDEQCRQEVHQRRFRGSVRAAPQLQPGLGDRSPIQVVGRTHARQVVGTLGLPEDRGPPAHAQTAMPHAQTAMPHGVVERGVAVQITDRRSQVLVSYM